MPMFEGVSFLGKPTRVDAGTHNGARNKPNEDRYTVFTGPGDNGQPVQFLVVADGVTSTHGGERASDIAVRLLQQTLQAPTQAAVRTGAKTLRDRLADAIHRANQEILETARKDPELKGMSTTLVAAAIEGNQLLLMHLGDSRAYLVRDGKAFQLTRDHTWVQEALEEGRITREQAANHPNKHVILRYLGDARGISIDQGILDPDKSPVDIDETEVGRQQARAGDTALTLRAGDALLLCSDGLYGRILDAEIAGAVTSYAPEKAVKSLIEEAVKRQEPDNITLTLWTTAGMVAPVIAAKATRRPALLLAAAGALLAVLAFIVIGMVSGGNPGNGEAQTASPATVEGVSLAAETEAPVTEAALMTETAPVTETALMTETAPVTETALVTESTTVEPSATVAPAETAPLEAAPPAAGDLPTTTATAMVTETAALSETVTPGLPTVTGAPETVANSQAAPSATLAAANATTKAAATSLANTPAGNAATSTPVTTRTPPPTSTPMATATPIPSSTSTATATRVREAIATSGSTPGSSASSQASSNDEGPISVHNLQPPDNEASSSPVNFAWVPDRPLAANQQFEVKFWRTGETDSDGKSWVGASTETLVKIDPAKQTPGTYQWAVFLVSIDPYGPLRRISEIRTFTASGGSTPSDDDDGSGEGGGSTDDSGSVGEK